MEHQRPALTIQLFGGFNAAIDGTPITAFESDRGRALLAYLLVEADHPHSREQLAGLLWPEQPEERARQNLSQALYNLRNLLDDRQASQPYLLSNKISIQFNPASRYQTDVGEFERLLTLYKAHNHAEAIACSGCVAWLETALATYQGEYLAGFSLSDCSAFEEWRTLHQERLHRQAVSAAGALLAYQEERGALVDALSLAWRLVEWDPFSEQAMILLLKLLAATGQHNQALAKYRDFQHLLADELNIEPGKEISALYLRLRDEAALRSGAKVAPHNLPPNLTPFVGRSVEIQELARRLRSTDCRLLSLVGPGGSGKTRLALQTARTLLVDFPDGVFFVPLGALSAANGIALAMGDAMGISFDKSLQQEWQLLGYLGDKRLLLVLDGFEHLMAGTGMIERLLRAAPDVKILVTTRAKLKARYETVYTLAGLGVAGVTADASAALASEAVQLFLSGARRGDAGFSLNERNLADVISICRVVQGMPLGILLASAWAALLEPGEIARRIGDNLDFLKVDWQDLPERLRSLRATFNYSWDLLGEAERQVFQSLAVFRGGFTLQAAEAVTGCSIGELQALSDKSLVQRTPGVRFELHELVRQYAAEKLAHKISLELEKRDRHSAYYLEMARNAEADLMSARQQAALNALEMDSENLRQAWDWGVENSHLESLMAAITGVCTFYELRWRYLDGEQACRKAAESTETLPGKPANILLHLGARTWQLYFNCLLNHVGMVQPTWDELQAHFTLVEARGLDVRWERALACYARGLVEKDLLKAGECLQGALALFRELGDGWRAAGALTRLGMIYNRQGSYPQAIEMHQASLALRRELGEAGETAAALQYLSYAFAFHGQLAQAQTLMQEASQLYRSLGTAYGEACAKRHLGVIYLWLGKFDEACTFLEESLPLIQRIGLQVDEIAVHAVLGITRLHLGAYSKARANAAIACAMAQQRRIDRETAGTLVVLACLDLVEDNPSSALERAQEAVGIYRGLKYSSELGWGLACLGLARRALGDHPGARQALCEMLRLLERSAGGHISLIFGLPLAALLLVDEGRLELGLEIWALARNLPAVANSCWVAQVAGGQILAKSCSLPPTVQVVAWERGKDRDPFTAAGWLSGILGCMGG